MVPAATAPDTEEASTPRRSEPRSCHSFLSQCSLTFSLQPSCFPTEESKVAFVIMHLAGIAREWGMAMWDNKHECCSSYTDFSQELQKVFDRSAQGNEAVRALSLLRQGTRPPSSSTHLPRLAAGTARHCGIASSMDWLSMSRMRSTPWSCPPYSMGWSNSPLGLISAWRSGRAGSFISAPILKSRTRLANS